MRSVIDWDDSSTDLAHLSGAAPGAATSGGDKLWEDNWDDDDIEDVSSPPPRTNRKPSKTTWDSDIEEVDSPPPRPTTSRVTLVREEDIEDFDELAQAEGPSDDVMVQCRADLLILRKRVR